MERTEDGILKDKEKKETSPGKEDSELLTALLFVESKILIQELLGIIVMDFLVVLNCLCILNNSHVELWIIQ